MAALTVMAVGIATAHAEHKPEKIKPYAVGGSLGMVNFTGGSAFQFAAHADLGNPTKWAGFALFPSISFWSKSYQYFGSESISVHELNFNADAHYYFNPEANTNFYAGGGLGLSTVSAGGVSDNGLALRFLGGLETPISAKKSLVAQATYQTRSNFSELSFHLGLTFDLTH